MPSGKHLPLFPRAEWPRPLGAPGEAWTLFSSAEPTVCPGCQPQGSERSSRAGSGLPSLFAAPSFHHYPLARARPRPHPQLLIKGPGAPRIPPLGIPPGSPDPSPGSQMSGPLSPESLRPFLVPRQRTSGPLGPGAPGPPSARLAGPPPLSAGGRTRAARPAALGAARLLRRTQRQRPPTPPRRRDVRSLPGGGGGTHRAWGGARGGSSPPPPARPPALAGRRAAPAPAPPPPPHPAPAPERPPLPLLTVSVGRAGGERPGRAGDGACAEAATAATATAAARPGFNTSGRRRRRAGALKGTRPYCQPAEDELQPESLGPLSEQLLLWKISVGRDARDPNNSSNPTSWMRKTWSKLKTPHPQSGTKAGLPLEDSACPFSFLRSGYEAYIYQTFQK